MDNHDITYVVKHNQPFLCLPEYQTVLLVPQISSKVQIAMLYSVKGGNLCPGACVGT